MGAIADAKTDVTEKVRGMDGKPVKIGTVVKREKTPHPWYGYLKKIHGRVVRIYRLPEKGDRVLVDIVDRDGRLHPTYLDQLKRSMSKRV